MAVLTLHFAFAFAHATQPSCEAPILVEAAASFREDGYAVLRQFASEAEVVAMREAMQEMVVGWWREESQADVDNVFVTGDNQTKAQAASRYFFDSAARVHFFREPGDAPKDGSPPALNKVGHGLHLDNSTPFGAYSRSRRIAEVARTVAGLRAPVLPQSMYIFKGAHVGGVVTSHQDGTFLYTRPRQSVVGLWLALHDAHEGNGCLWARPGSHHEPLRRRFVRTENADGETVMTFVNASAKKAESFWSADPWWRRAWGWLAGRWLGRSRGPAPSHRRVLESAEAARAWEGSWPPSERDLDAAELTARGFVPLPVRAGDLVVFPGTLDHLSLPNSSPDDRHTFQLHVIEGPDAGVSWAAENWLQYPSGKAFPVL